MFIYVAPINIRDFNKNYIKIREKYIKTQSDLFRVMINAILIFNNQGKPRFVQFYKYVAEKKKQEILEETFKIISSRQVGNSKSQTDKTYCSFIDTGLLCETGTNRIVYRHYATLYFVFAVDKCESELGILDLIQVLVEVLDRVFENVCELDLIFHMEKVQYILSEMVQGGMVLETSLSTIVHRINEQEKLESVERTENTKTENESVKTAVFCLSFSIFCYQHPFHSSCNDIWRSSSFKLKQRCSESV